MPKMVSRFPGTCRKCGKRFSAGTEIMYQGKGLTYHVACATAETPKRVRKEDVPGHTEGARYMIEWPALREIVRDAFKGEYRHTRIRTNTQTIEYYTHRVSQSFTGYSMAQAKDWLENGYEIPGLADLSDFAPPIREKRKFIYSDEGDEIDLSAAWAGEDNFMGSWTKRDSIPGIAMEFECSFVSSTPASVVNAYLKWLAQAVFAIESAGIDPEISLSNPGCWYWDNDTMGNVVVRVKKEMETVDQNSWSAMLSPAAFRTYMFIATVLAGEARGKAVDMGISRSHGGDSWEVKYDSENGVIRTKVPYKPSSFPEEEMTAQLRQAINELRGKFN